MHCPIPDFRPNPVQLSNLYAQSCTKVLFIRIHTLSTRSDKASLTKNQTQRKDCSGKIQEFIATSNPTAQCYIRSSQEWLAQVSFKFNPIAIPIRFLKHFSLHFESPQYLLGRWKSTYQLCYFYLCIFLRF